MLFVPEAKPRDTNHTVGIIAIWYFDKEHILIAQSVAEACYLEIKHIFILQNVQKVSNAGWKSPLFQENEAGADLGTLERGAWARGLNLSYAIIILKSFKMLKTKDLYLSANFRNIIWKTPYNLIYHLICYYRIMFQLFFIINLMNHFR